MKETGYIFQAALISLWWIGLATSSRFFSAFQFEGISSTAFWAFFVPDVVLIAILSATRAYLKRRELELIVLGAFAYAALYCCNATILTGDGWLSTGLMVVGLSYNAFLCFHSSMFRASNTTSVLANGVKTLIQIVCVWVLTLGVVPFILIKAFGGELVFPNFIEHVGVNFWIGLAIFVLAGSLGLTSAYFMVKDGKGTPIPLDQTNELVVSGPYQFVRNPMAIAGIAQGLAVALIFLSVPILIYSILGAVVWHYVVRPIEERDMIDRFGESYLDYQQRVICWIPRFGSESSSRSKS